MRRLFVVLIVISFLAQSCYTHRTVDLSKQQLEVGKRYKVKHGDQVVLGRVTSIDNSSVMIDQGRIVKEVPLAEISDVKRRKFSVLKTASVPVGFVAVIVGLSAIFYKPHLGELNASR